MLGVVLVVLLEELELGVFLVFIICIVICVSVVYSLWVLVLVRLGVLCSVVFMYVSYVCVCFGVMGKGRCCVCSWGCL